MIDELNRRMCDFTLARLDAMGEVPGGLYNYYAHLSKRGTMIRPEEVAVAEYIDRVVPRGTRILELCAGAAQLGHLLSLMGYQVTAVEIDPLRCEFAKALGVHVGSECTVTLGSWQSLRLADYRLLVTINAVTEHIAHGDTELVREHVIGGGDLIIRPRQFGAGIAAEIDGLVATPVTNDVYHYAV